MILISGVVSSDFNYHYRVYIRISHISELVEVGFYPANEHVEQFYRFFSKQVASVISFQGRHEPTKLKSHWPAQINAPQKSS